MSEAYSGNEPVTAPGIHDMPSSAAGQPSPKMMKRFGDAFVNRVLAMVLYALAGIEVFGVNPFGFLRAWADEFAQRADDAYAAATGAQQTADDVAETTEDQSSLIEGILGNLQELFGRYSKLEEKYENLRKQFLNDPGDVGGNDKCTGTSKVVNVLGTVQSSIYGWWYSPNDPASFLYADSPATDRHGNGAIVTSKQPGRFRLDICCNATKTNGAGLQIRVRGWPFADEVSIGYLTGPNTFVAVKTISLEIRSDWVWKLWYNPGDPDDPDDEYANTFFVILNNEEVYDLRWTDGGEQVLHGADYRHTGGCLNAAGDNFVRGPVPTEYGYYDEGGAVPATLAEVS